MHTQLCPTLSGPMHFGQPDSSVHGISQARILERLRFPTPGNRPDPGIKPKSLMSPALAGGFLPCTDICPGVGMLVHIATIFHFLRGTCVLFSIVAAPVYIPANSVGGSPFLHTLSSIYYL